VTIQYDACRRLLIEVRSEDVAGVVISHGGPAHVVCIVRGGEQELMLVALEGWPAGRCSPTTKSTICGLDAPGVGGVGGSGDGPTGKAGGSHLDSARARVQLGWS
jgi:hypothetical protein